MPSSSDLLFQSSLRSAAKDRSPSPSDPKLHRGCSGVIHAHGCGKVRTKQPVPAQSRRPSPDQSFDYEQQREHNYHQPKEQEPLRKKSMLGLGSVLIASPSSNAGLPPRCPPAPRLSHANRSLSSSTCSSSGSSSRPSSGIGSLTGSPAVCDENPMSSWPTVSSWLEQVNEEDDDNDEDSTAESFRFDSPIGASSPVMSKGDRQRVSSAAAAVALKSTPKSTLRGDSKQNRSTGPSSLSAFGSTLSKKTAPVRRSNSIPCRTDGASGAVARSASTGAQHKRPVVVVIKKPVSGNMSKKETKGRRQSSDAMTRATENEQQVRRFLCSRRIGPGKTRRCYDGNIIKRHANFRSSFPVADFLAFALGVTPAPAAAA